MKDFVDPRQISQFPAFNHLSHKFLALAFRIGGRSMDELEMLRSKGLLSKKYLRALALSALGFVSDFAVSNCWFEGHVRSQKLALRKGTNIKSQSEKQLVPTLGHWHVNLFTIVGGEEVRREKRERGTRSSFSFPPCLSFFLIRRRLNPRHEGLGAEGKERLY